MKVVLSKSLINRLVANYNQSPMQVACAKCSVLNLVLRFCLVVIGENRVLDRTFVVHLVMDILLSVYEQITEFR